MASYSAEGIELWFARGLVAGERRLDEGEFLNVFTATVPSFSRWGREGRVTDAKTPIGALWLRNVIAGSWSLELQDEPPLGVATSSGTA